MQASAPRWISLVVALTASVVAACSGGSNSGSGSGGSGGGGGVAASGGTGAVGGSSGNGGAAGASGGAGGTAPSGSCANEWACWPMPNPPSTGLPNPASYDTSTPGIVIDNVTSLVWQRVVDAKSYTWADAKTYCSNLSLAGQTDWRLPTELELYSLEDFTRSNPSIDVKAFPNTPADAFWASTPLAGDSTKAWVAEFDIPYADNGDATSLSRVRCVRSAVAKPASHYTVGPDTVTDTLTGLTWQRQTEIGPNYDGLALGDAESYCKTLSLDGGGWRLPSVKELITLVDYTVPPLGPTLDQNAFPKSSNQSYWSSSLMAGATDSAWQVGFKYGSALLDSALADSFVRCVR